MKSWKRVTGLLLAACLTIGMVPTMASAESGNGENTGSVSTDKTIMLGTSGISAYNGNIANVDTIYYGVYNTNYDVPWYAVNLDTKVNEQVSLSTWEGAMLSKYTLGTSPFSKGENTLQGMMKGLYEGDELLGVKSLFTEKEKGAIDATTLSDYAHLFPLSKDEASNLVVESDILKAKDISNSGAEIAEQWWLRTQDGYNVYYVAQDGSIGSNFSSYDCGVRPAFNLKLDSVLFSSAAKDGKNSSGSLSTIGSYNGNEWKLTLKDTSRTFAVIETEVTGKSEGTITLNYTGATFGTNEYVSIILEDSNNNLTHYGRVAQPADTIGSFEFKLPSGLSDGTYTLHVFSEQYNGDYKTDYASAFDNVTLTVKNPTQTTDTTDNSNSNDTSTSTETTTTETVEAAPITITYTVKKDDYMRKIAREHGITLEQLIALNPQIKNPNLIYAGQVLIVGQTGSTAVTTETTATKTYTVQRGDSLYKIARKNGMTLAELKSLNENLFAQKYIFAGQTVLLK